MFNAIVAGDSTQLGSYFDGEGTNFALFSANAHRVELCIYDTLGKQELARYDLPEKQDTIWHGYIPGLTAGYCYGYRVHGDYEPLAGHRFNPNKLLLDPYAKQQQGPFIWNDSHFAYDKTSAQQDLSYSHQDNAAFVPKSVISDTLKTEVEPQRVWRRPLSKSIIYEMHVKGFTQLNTAIPEALRGTFKGLAQPPVVDYLKALGISTVELLPVHSYTDEYFLHQRGLHNYWGYNSINFFSPHQAYVSGSDIFEFRQMVDSFHDAGIEVIIDVVYNHTAESDHLGPSLCYRGIDNASYYALQPENKRFYINDTGCGNVLNINHPRVLHLVLDSLRYWVTVMGVDGFRFDLAPILGREPKGFNPCHAFFKAVDADPVLSACKLIAEPWDIGPGGYQLGNFPKPWSEWNDKYRDSTRRFWRGDKGALPDFAKRLHGSADIYEQRSKLPSNSVNLITAHDGFTLRDVVSYKDRHNLANGENNRDGHHDNLSLNFGFEGETDDPDINQSRLKQQKNLLTTLLLSQGVPMLLGGDELGRSQKGNNNAYCQDNAINWLSWADIDKPDNDLLDFVKALIALRKQYEVFSFSDYVHQPESPSEAGVYWFNFDGDMMRTEHWEDPNRHHFILLLKSSEWQKDTGECLALVFNNNCENLSCYLPSIKEKSIWHGLLSTSGSIKGDLVNTTTPITSIEQSVSVYRLAELTN